MNLWRQFKTSPWMPLDTIRHHPRLKRLFPDHVRHWICDKLDASLGVFEQDEEGYEEVQGL